MDYVLAGQASAYRTSKDSFLTDGPFGKHLLELKDSLPAKFDRLVLFGPEMTDETVKSLKDNVTFIDEKLQNIVFVPSHKLDDSTTNFWTRRAYGIWKKSKSLLRNDSVLHVDLSTDIRRPMTAIVARAAKQAGRPVCFVTDIDFREHANRARKLGEATRLSYALAKTQQHFKAAQVRDAVANSQLVLLKSPSMVADFGNNAPHVKNFFDVVHSEEDVLDLEQEASRLDFLQHADRPLRLCYFGRLVKYKGIERMIEAIAVARDKGVDLELWIIGEGPEHGGLSRQVTELRLEQHVTFRPAASYGPALFDELCTCHAMINAPLREDTPRAAFDAMARGLPILAFDISYFRDLSKQSGAVVLATWPESLDLANKAIALSENRKMLADLAAKGLAFARENTQPIWLKRRITWLMDFASGMQPGKN
jgi:glycosyltransferase involved in cell wall biosynthesis